MQSGEHMGPACTGLWRHRTIQIWIGKNSSGSSFREVIVDLIRLIGLSVAAGELPVEFIGMPRTVWVGTGRRVGIATTVSVIAAIAVGPPLAETPYRRISGRYYRK
jgi:hypothetical protein